MKFVHILFAALMLSSSAILMADAPEKDSANISAKTVNDLPVTAAGSAGMDEDCGE